MSSALLVVHMIAMYVGIIMTTTSLGTTSATAVDYVAIPHRVISSEHTPTGLRGIHGCTKAL